SWPPNNTLNTYESENVVISSLPPASSSVALLAAYSRRFLTQNGAVSFRDGTYRTDVAAAGEVFRQYRGRRSWFPISLLARGGHDTNDTNAARPRCIADTGSR